MATRAWSAVLSICFLTGCFLVGTPGPCEAIYVDKSNTLLIQGKFNTLATWRTADTPETNMVPIQAGDLVQHRSTFIIDLKHNLGELFPVTTVSYYVQGRGFYDGVWDYGPSAFASNVSRRTFGLSNRDEIDEEKWDVELFQAYLDMNWGGFSLRIGKQALSWGEMSVLRIFDASNPLDNQSVGVDLEERILPLSMIKLVFATYDLGFLESASFEGYFMPSFENYNGEVIIAGSAIMPPIGRYNAANPFPPLPYVDIEIREPRYGIRIGGIVGELQMNLGYYRKYGDVAYPRIRTSSFYVGLPSTMFINVPDAIELVTDVVDVWGGNFNYYWQILDVVVRGEIGYFIDEPMRVEGVNSPRPQPTVPLNFSNGKVPHYDVIRYGLGVDKNVRIRFLNNKKDFVLKLEYVGDKIIHFDKKTLWGWDDPDTGNTRYKDEYSSQIVFIAVNDWFSGNVEMSFTSIYDIEAKALLLMPRVTLSRHGNVEMSLSYRHTYAGSYKGIGYLQDANEVQVGFSYFF